MKVESRLFLAVALFCWLAALGYGIWTGKSQHHVEVVGVAALILSHAANSKRLAEEPQHISQWIGTSRAGCGPET